TGIIVLCSVSPGARGKAERRTGAGEGDCLEKPGEKVSCTSVSFSKTCNKAAVHGLHLVPRKHALLKLHQKCVSLKHECQSLLEKMNSTLATCSHRRLLPEIASRAYQTGCRILLAVIPRLEQQEPLDEEQVGVLHSYVTSVHPLLAEVNSGIQEASQRGLQEDREKKRQQQQQQQQQERQISQQTQQQSPQDSSQKTTSSQLTQSSPVSSVTNIQRADGLLSTPMGISLSVVEQYSRLQEKLAQITKSCEALTKDAQSKRYKFDLQKAVCTPINAISGQSGEHLVEKIRRINAVLSGKRVQVTGRQVSASDHPQGRAFCFNLLAQKIVKQGDEQVSSQSNAAFLFAMVAVSLCVSFPDLRDLILAHFHASCPVLVPFYVTSKDLSDNDRCRLLGYKVSSDGQVEGEDSYLRRMSGIVRLYAAILQTPTKPRPHPTRTGARVGVASEGPKHGATPISDGHGSSRPAGNCRLCSDERVRETVSESAPLHMQAVRTTYGEGHPSGSARSSD
ncbi:Nucleoporin GLE1, partial [Geodia barretti]